MNDTIENNERCLKCIIPKSAHNIRFDEKGCCELCNKSTAFDSNIKQTELNTEEITTYINKIKQNGRGRLYDCLVGVSGGRDSSYLLYLLVKKYKLRCLAAYHKTPFTPDIIDKNLRSLVKRLGVPLIEMNISKEKHRKFTKKIVEIWLKKPNSIVANIACAPCKLHNYEVYKIAFKHKIKSIVFGSNHYEEFQLGAAQSKKMITKKYRQIKLWQKLYQLLMIAKRGFFILLKQPELLQYFPTIFKASVLYINNRTPYLRLLYPNLSMLDYYFVAGYNEREVLNFLTEINWKLPENCNSTWRADCSFSELKNLMFKKTSGISYVDAYFSNMIRGGLLSREEALKRIKTEGKISQARIKEVCEILGISSKLFK